MSLPTIWRDLYPGLPWPGDEEAVNVMADEIRSLRILAGIAAQHLEPNPPRRKGLLRVRRRGLAPL
jgi:hypothetical protein